MSKCVKCGKDVTGKFCSECGTPVSQTNEQPIVNDEYIVGKQHGNVRTKITNVVLWIVSIALLFIGLGGILRDDILAGGFMMLLGLVFCPFVIGIITPLFGGFNRAWFRSILCVICFALIVVAGNKPSEKDVSTGLGITASSQFTSSKSESSKDSSATSNASSSLEDSSTTSSSETSDFFLKDDKLIVGKSIDPTQSTINELKQQGFTQAEAEEMQEIFLSIGVDNVCNITPAIGQGIDIIQSFLATANSDKEKFHFTVEKRKLFYAGFAGTDLYDTELGGILGDINNVQIPVTEISEGTEILLIEKSKELVKSYLNYPSTAKFDMFNWMISRRNEEYYVSGSVDAKNAFGVKSTLNFSLYYTAAEDTFTLKDISMF